MYMQILLLRMKNISLTNDVLWRKMVIFLEGGMIPPKGTAQAKLRWWLSTSHGIYIKLKILQQEMKIIQ